MTERRIACFPAEKAPVARMRGSLKGFTSIELFADAPDLMSALRTGSIAATLFVVDAPGFELAEHLLRRIRADFPTHPLVVYYNARGLSPRHLFLLAQIGVDDLVQLDVDDSKHVFNVIMELAEQRTHAQLLADRLAQEVPAPIRAVFIFALIHAGQSVDVPQLAASLGVNKRTLAWRLSQFGYPSPRMLLTWCRLLVAGHMLDERGRTLDSVAAQLEYPGGHTLGAVFHRYCHRGVSSMRHTGILEGVLDVFRHSITPPAIVPKAVAEAPVKRGRKRQRIAN